jgi:hypothetical protein
MRLTYLRVFALILYFFFLQKHFNTLHDLSERAKITNDSKNFILQVNFFNYCSLCYFFFTVAGATSRYRSTLEVSAANYMDTGY